MNQRKNDDRRAMEAVRLLIMGETISSQEKRINELEALLARASYELDDFVTGCESDFNGWGVETAKLLIAEINATLQTAK